MNSFFDRIRNLIAVQDSDQLEVAFNDLINFLKGANERNEYHTVILLSAQYYRLKTENRKGRISNNDFNVEINKLSYRLLETLDILETSMSNANLPASKDTNVNVSDFAFEKIIGKESMIKNIAWLEKGLECSKSVCRVVNSATKSLGTGFIVQNGWLLTNNHVISTDTEADDCEVEFNYIYDDKDRDKRVCYKLDSSTFETYSKLDITRVKIKKDISKEPLSNWGELKISTKPIQLDQHVTIIQHPRGAAKSIALNENKVINLYDFRIHYTTDTEAGSSGSPVFNDSWEVIAIHNAGGNLVKNNRGDKIFANQGILMSNICDLFRTW